MAILNKRLFLCWLGLLPWLAKAQDVQITPQYPQRGQQVTITYTPAKKPAAGKPLLVFTYSNLYELPWQIALQQKGTGWYASFPLQRYATYATFFIKDGNDTVKPAAGKHYALAVYTPEKIPVKNGRLYQGYSLGAQMGRSPRLPVEQERLLKEELADYPDNYEARVRLYQNEIARVPENEKAGIRAQAHQYIAAWFDKDPVANMNLATMGYLILGENRTDSVYRLIRERFPQTATGTEMRIEQIIKEKDTVATIAMLEKELAAATPQNKEGLLPAHKALFDYYAAKGNGEKALYHARHLLSRQSPYLPKEVLEIASTLAVQSLVPDSALKYAIRSRQLADSFPAGLIRYFKETGYIPSYVSDSARKAVQQKATGNSLAVIGMIYANKGDQRSALRYIDSAMAIAKEEETLQYAATGLERLHLYERAYDAHKQRLLHAAVTDTAMEAVAKKDYLQWKGATGDWAAEWRVIQAGRQQLVMEQMRTQLLHAKAPSLEGIVTLENKAVLPDTLRNKIIVIDFWATWCIPCMQEMPYLQKVYDRFRNDPRVAFMVINSGARNTLQDAQGWFGNKKYSFPVYFHTNPAVGELFSFNVIPALYIIDNKGLLQYKHIGFEGPQVEEHLKTVIDLLLQR
jgi:thiol-disulfide isomerase/thioredoxin